MVLGRLAASSTASILTAALQATGKWWIASIRKIKSSLLFHRWQAVRRAENICFKASTRLQQRGSILERRYEDSIRALHGGTARPAATVTNWTERRIDPNAILEPYNYLGRPIRRPFLYGDAVRSEPSRIERVAEGIYSFSWFVSPLRNVLPPPDFSWRSNEPAYKGIQLFSSVVGEAELGQHRDLGFTDVASPSKPDRMYRLRTNQRVGVVDKINGVWVERQDLSYCIITADGSYVPGDDLAAKALLIRHNEARFLQTANRFDYGAEGRRSAMPLLGFDPGSVGLGDYGYLRAL